jgi:hypothetical protein
MRAVALNLFTFRYLTSPAYKTKVKTEASFSAAGVLEQSLQPCSPQPGVTCPSSLGAGKVDRARMDSAITKTGSANPLARNQR